MIRLRAFALAAALIASACQASGASQTGGGAPTPNVPWTMGNSDATCPAAPGLGCITFTVTSDGAPLANVCVVVQSPKPDACPEFHYGTQADGTVRIGTLGADSPATAWFLYPGKELKSITVRGGTTATVTLVNSQ